MIKNNLSRILGEKCISIKKLSDIAGLQYSSLRLLARKQTKQIEFETINKICKALNIGVAELFEYVED